jgi:hypothetical protein
MQGGCSQHIRVRLGLCYFFAMLLILCVWHSYVRQQTKVYLRGLRSNTSVYQTSSTINALPPQNGITRKLSFLVAGVQKAGTTALFKYLQQHPHLSLPNWKESHFFDNETINWTAPDYTAYEFSVRLRTKSAIAGEATPIYIYWPNSLERIKRYNPDMKLIILFRQPVQRAWSQWKMTYASGLETKPFPWAIRKGRARLTNNSEMPGYHRIFSYVERGFYGKQLERVLQIFPRQQLLLLLSEDLKADPTRIIRQISRFLQVPAPEGEIKQLTSHVSRQADTGAVLDESDVTYLQSLYNNDLKVFGELSSLHIASWFP